MSHHVTHASVSAWLAAYLHAWETYDPKDIEALFTEDAEYRFHPTGDPVVGREAIVDSWVNPGGNASGRDKAGTYSGEYEPFVGAGNRAVATGVSTYWTDASRTTVERLYYNCWLLEFADDGRCSSFVEYYMKPHGN